MAAVTIHSDFGAQENAFTFSSFICHEVMGLDAMILVFLMLTFKPAFSLSSFNFKRLFSSSFRKKKKTFYFVLEYSRVTVL